MKIPKLSLTKAKTLSMLSWGYIVLIQIIAIDYPIKGLPIPIKAVLVALILMCIITIFYTAISRNIEKPDERAIYNSYHANSTTFQIIYTIISLLVLVMYVTELESIKISAKTIILIFGIICFLQDAVFLCYEKFSKE